MQEGGIHKLYLTMCFQCAWEVLGGLQVWVYTLGFLSRV
jgi:hypothetical protein